MMTCQKHRGRVETNARRLDRARGLLGKAHLRFVLLGDVMAAYRLDRIITNLHTQRQHWLQAVDSPLP